MESAVVTLPEASKLHPHPPRERRRQRRARTQTQADDILFVRGIFGFLTVVSALLGLGLFFYFAYCTCGATGVVIATSVAAFAAYSLVRFVLLS